MPRSIIEVVNVSKVFGEQTVLKAVTVAFEEGKITGIIGRNGSGKTVLLKCILGLIPVKTGSVLVDGCHIGKDADFPKDVGFIINMPGFLPNYSGYMNLKFLASIQKKIGRDEIMQAMRTAGLDPENPKRVGKYSMGMRQRLALAQALMEDPKILILDEPMNSLDNDGVLEMRSLIAGLSKRGKTVIITSHNHEDIETLCDAVYEMDHGTLTQSAGIGFN